MQGKSLIEMFLFVHKIDGLSVSENKKELLSTINYELSTSYNINALNNYISERRPLPSSIQKIAP